MSLEGVGTMPMGLTEHYLRKGVAKQAKQAMEAACLDLSACKRRQVLAQIYYTILDYTILTYIIIY